MIWTAFLTFESRIIWESFNFCHTNSLRELYQKIMLFSFCLYHLVYYDVSQIYGFFDITLLSLLIVMCHSNWSFFIGVRTDTLYFHVFLVFFCLFLFFLRFSCIVLHLGSKFSRKDPQNVLHCPALSNVLWKKCNIHHDFVNTWLNITYFLHRVT